MEWFSDLGFLGPTGEQTRAAKQVRGSYIFVSKSIRHTNLLTLRGEQVAAFARGERQNGVPGQIRK